ncbi:MAG: GTPase HflX, partial [Armatimonadetes bacterium]|nr:GTPase HflX [Armatimonadota bacterium]
MSRKMISNEPQPERAVLVAIERRGEELDQDLEELQELVRTAGGDAVEVVVQRRAAPNPATYLGSGKVQEVKELAAAHQADLIIVDDELTPVQARNLNEQLDRPVLDRTQLIL